MGKILFIRGGAVGDFILTLPALQLVRETLPETPVEILGYEPMIRLAEAYGLAQGVRSIEYGALAPFFAPRADLNAELTAYFADFSVIVSYLHDPDSVFHDNIARCTKATFLTGPHRPLEIPPYQSAVVQLARPLQRIGLFLDTPWASLPPAEELGIRSDPLIDDLFATGQPLIALHPGSGSPKKNWSWEGWIQVIKALRGSFPQLGVVVTSGEAEDERIGQFTPMLEAEGLPFSTLRHKPLPLVAAALRHCALYLGNDSGISHLAAATGIPAVLLFGPSVAEVWAPANPSVQLVRSASGDMAGIRANEVARVALKALAQSGFSPR